MRSNAMFILLGGLALVRCWIRCRMHPYNGIYYFHQQNISIVSLSSLLMLLTNANKYFKNFFFAFHMWLWHVSYFSFLFISFRFLRHRSSPPHTSSTLFSSHLQAEFSDAKGNRWHWMHRAPFETELVSERDGVVAEMSVSWSCSWKVGVFVIN